MVDIDDVLSVLRQREVDIVMTRAPEPHEVHLHAEFDGYGDFFSILASDVEYIDMPGRMTLADLRRIHDLREAAAIAAKWGGLMGRYSGPALLFRSADTDTWEATAPGDVGILVANTLCIQPGTDWTRVNPRHLGTMSMHSTTGPTDGRRHPRRPAPPGLSTPMKPSTIRFTRWRRDTDVRTIELAKLIRASMCAPDFARAKAIVDAILDGDEPTVTLADDVNPTAFCQRCQELGVASHVDNEMTSTRRKSLERISPSAFELEKAAPSDDHPLWASFVAAENAFVAARMALIRGAADVPAIVARALRVPSERGAALRLLLILPEEQTRPHLASLVDLASVGHSDLELCRSVILRIDHGWLLSHIDAHVHAALAQGGEEAHRRIAELYTLIDAGLLQRHLVRCSSSADADTRAIVADFSNK